MKEMKQYTGTKTVMAMPMRKAEAERLLGRFLPDSAEDEGYYITYPDGFKSWSPKKTFDNAYKVAETYLDRMRIEYGELKTRLLALHSFIMSEAFRDMPKNKQASMHAQNGAMTAYAQVLAQRIDEERKEQQKDGQERMDDCLVGKTVVRENKCDFCKNCDADCKKIYLADGSCICLK